MTMAAAGPAPHAPDPSAAYARRTATRHRFGVRVRLLLAFLGISAFAVLSAAAAIYAFGQVGDALDRITERRVPAALRSLELSRQAERIVRAAPALLTAETIDQWHAAQRSIADEVAQLNRLLAALRPDAAGTHGDFLEAAEPLVARLEVNLDGLNVIVGSRLAVAAQRARRLRQLTNTTVAARRLVAPGLLVMESQLAAWDRLAAEEGGTLALAASIIDLIRQQRVEVAITTVNDLLIQAATVQDANELAVLVFPLDRALDELDRGIAVLPPRLTGRARGVMGAYRGLAAGDDSLPRLRRIELSLVANARSLLEQNARLSQQLTAAVDALVDSASGDIAAAGADVATTRGWSTAVLVGVVVLSLVSSALIVWLYVDRDLVARLTGLSDSMLAIAGGNLRAPLPPAGNSDEIDRMAQALAVFRDTAVEIEEQNLREVARARRQVMESIRYASRIQSAILPAPETLAAAVPEHFVIWEPRDIVGGDVYWCSPVEGGHVLLVGDCTGHGVPGAFMTLIATGVLDDVAREMPGSNPARMLARVHARLRAVLGKERSPAGFTDDGLEAGLCYIPFRRDLLVFAGAHLSLWRARDGAVREIKGDRPMLGFQHDPDDIAFTNKPLDVRRGDCFYLATDGLTDQIGGPRRRAFGKRRLAAFAAKYHRRPMNQQGSILRSLFVDHQGDEARRDDVAVLGFAPLGLGAGGPAA